MDLGESSKSSGADHATVSAAPLRPTFAAVIVLLLFFASDIPKSQILTERSLVSSTFPAFMSPCTMDTSGRCRYAMPVAVSAAILAVVARSRTSSTSRSRTSSEPPSQSSITIHARSGTTPNTRRMFGWFNEHMIIASRRTDLTTDAGTFSDTLAEFTAPPAVANMAFTATACPLSDALNTAP